MCKRIYIIPMALYIRHILYISFHVKCPIGQFFPGVRLYSQIIYFAIIVNAVACAIFIHFFLIILQPLSKKTFVFLYYHLIVTFDWNRALCFSTEDTCVSPVIEHPFFTDVFPLSDLGSLLNLS